VENVILHVWKRNDEQSEQHEASS
jgi:hypothetical protein